VAASATSPSRRRKATSIMGQVPYSLWEAAFGRFKSAERELNSARAELDRLKSRASRGVAGEYGAALRAWCGAVVSYGESLKEYTALLGSIEFI
jgi:hypothetical protein